MRKGIAKTISFLLAALLLTGCAGKGSETPTVTAPPEEETSDLLINGQAPIVRQSVDHVFSLNYDPDAPLNPIRAESSANMQFWSLLYDSVFTLDEDFNVSSEIVREIRTEDYQWWVFDLNTDICFSDGTPLTAQDVAYSIQRAQQTSYYRERLSIIYGVSAMGTDCFAVSTYYADSQLPALLNIPISLVVQRVTGIHYLRSSLPWLAGLILVVISVGLTLISGLIPSRIAAKKDPVEALRTE